MTPFLIAAKTRLKVSSYQIFCSLFCSYSLTEAHGKWRYTDADITNDKGHRGHRTPTWWVTGSTLTLFVNTSGLFILCGNKVYKGFPPKWSGRCGLGYLAPSLTSYPTLNASRITDLASFRRKVAPRRHIQPEIIGKPLMYRNTDSVRTLFPSLKTSDLEEAIRNTSKVKEQGFTGTPQTLKARPSGVSRFASVLWNRRLLATQAARQGTQCAIIGSRCCLYVNKSKEVQDSLNRIKERVDILRKMSEAPLINWTDLENKRPVQWKMGLCVGICSFMRIHPCYLFLFADLLPPNF